METESKPRCHHIMESGRRCGTPPVKGQHFCFYHDRLHRNYVLPGHRFYEMPNLDNAHGIQIALTQLAAAIAKGLIGPKEAGKMAYSIQLAQSNLKRLAEAAVPPEEAETEITDGMVAALHLDQNSRSHDSQAQDPQDGADSNSNPAPPHTLKDYSQHPLSNVEGLRPRNDLLPSGEAPRWIPLSSEESEFVCDHMPVDERKATPLEKFCVRRLRLTQALQKIDNPTTQQVLQAVMQVEEEEKFAIQNLNDLYPLDQTTPPTTQNHRGREGARR